MVRRERLAQAAQAMTRLATRWDERLEAIERIAEAVRSERSIQATGEGRGGAMRR